MEHIFLRMLVGFAALEVVRDSSYGDFCVFGCLYCLYVFHVSPGPWCLYNPHILRDGPTRAHILQLSYVLFFIVVLMLLIVLIVCIFKNYFSCFH